MLAHCRLWVGQDCDCGAPRLFWLPPDHLKVEHAPDLPISLEVARSERIRTQQATFLTRISMDLDRILGGRGKPV